MNTTRQKTVDVVIPLYNCERFVAQAIESAAKQSYPIQTIYVIDDGSTDNGSFIVKKYAETYPAAPIVIVQQHNKGVSSARNKGIALSNADFVAFLDADDTWQKDKIAEQVKIFENNHDDKIGLVYCDYVIIGDDSKQSRSKKSIKPSLRGMVHDAILKENTISGGSQALVRRCVFEKVGNFDESLHFGEDWDMWIRISSIFAVDFSEKKLVSIRKHTANVTASLDRRYSGTLHLFNYWTERMLPKLPPQEWADRIIFYILLRLPSTRYISTAHEKLSERSRNALFRKTGGSIWKHIFVTATEQGVSFMVSREKRSRILQGLRSVLRNTKIDS